MKDIHDKYSTLRTAVAEAYVKAAPQAVTACITGDTPKGAVIDVARTAGIFAAKKTSEIIPYCHPVPIDCVSINIKSDGGMIKIIAGVTAVAKTGVEMEALTAASAAALTVYDMLKPIDDKIEISSVRLAEKHGGKSDMISQRAEGKSARILITSDRCARNAADDLTGPMIFDSLKKFGMNVEAPTIVQDERHDIEAQLKDWSGKGIDLIITSGGTGIGPRDVTVESTRAVMEREIPGVSEALRSFGQSRTPYAMLSRGIAGLCGKTLIVNLPGSVHAVRDSLALLLPAIFHAFEMIEGRSHK